MGYGVPKGLKINNLLARGTIGRDGLITCNKSLNLRMNQPTRHSPLTALLFGAIELPLARLSWE